jgi:thiamine-phosphate pyrophosphorylase
MKKYIASFHYLTQDLPERSHREQVEIACKAGANWIQYRCLTKNDKELIAEISELASVCDDWGATLIVTDHYHLLDHIDVQGVHIEDMDGDIKKIRKHIGPEKTLGASANTFEDIQRIHKSGAADYIGCGPFNFTRTKVNYYPVLSTEGYRKIIWQMKDKEIKIPLLAVGGVTINDVETLLTTGIHGIAVSGAVNMSEDPASAIKNFRSYFI